jgi:DNA repair exonuclease SbcCD ATPase subunit
MRIDFKSIYIEGFGSYSKPILFDFKEGLYLIKGRNGAGKTTLFNALVWCLYGKSIKDVKLKDIPSWTNWRTDSWSGTKVSVKFIIHNSYYEIIRHINYTGKTYGKTGNNSLLIFKDHNLVNTELYKSDQQFYINNLLGLSYIAFVNTVLFGQNLTKIINSSNEQKRIFIEELFNLNYLTELKTIASVKYKESKDLLEAAINNYKDQGYSYDLLLSKYKELETLLETLYNLKDTFETERKTYIESLDLKKLTLIDLRGQLENIQLKLNTDNLSDIELDIQKIKKSESEKLSQLEEFNKLSQFIDIKVSELNLKLQSHEISIIDYTNKLNSISEAVCFECKSVLNNSGTNILAKKYRYDLNLHNEQKDIINNSIIELNGKKDKLYSNKEIVFKELNLLQNEYNKIINLNNDILNLQKEYDILEIKIKAITESIQEYENSILKYTDNIQNLNIRDIQNNMLNLSIEIDSKKSDLVDLKALCTQLEYNSMLYSWWNTNGFTSRGLPAFIFDYCLEQTNMLIKRYTDYIGFEVKFSIDHTKVNKSVLVTIHKDDYIIEYDCLSGGERQKVDICLAFAFHDLYSTNYLNILMLDEVFESIDDYGGVDEVLELINLKMSNAKCVYIITHNQNLNVVNASDIIIDKMDSSNIQIC